MARHLFVFAACFLLAASPITGAAQTGLPDDARAVLRQTITQLQDLADQYQRNGQATQANAVLDQIRSIQLSVSLSSPILRMTGYRSHVGETFRVRVVGADGLGRIIWGTDIYTDDSDLSLAVVHAGLLRANQEGEVLITFLPGQSQYQGSTRNGVTSRDFMAFQGSYRLARADASSASVPVLPAPATQPPPALVVNAGPNGPPNAGVFVTGLPFPIDEQSVWQLLGGQPTGRTGSPPLVALRNHSGESFEFEVTGSQSGSVWGDGVYTDDSDLGAAAVHAGALHVGERGRVRITLLPGRSSYDGAIRNGVASRSYNAWQSSYRVEIPGSRAPLPNAASLASIGGRILDTNKRALRGVTIAASGPETYVTTTNAEGDYFIAGVLPGNYLVTAVGAPSSQSAPPLPAYFPGGLIRSAASLIPVQGGQHIVGADFVMETPKLFKVSGKVLNPPPSGGVPTISVIPRDTTAPSTNAAILLTNTSPGASSGDFELMLPAGAWDVFPLVPLVRTPATPVPTAGTAAYAAGRLAVDVMDRNVEGLTVKIGYTTIPGRIVVDPQVKLPAGFSLSSIEVHVSAVDGTPAPLWYQSRLAKVRDDGSFSLTALPQGSYRLEFSPAIPGITFRDVGVIRAGGASGDPAEITVNLRASQ